MLRYYALLICRQACYQCTLKEAPYHVASDPFDLSLEGKQEHMRQIKQCIDFFNALLAAKPASVRGHESVPRIGNLLYTNYQSALAKDLDLLKNGMHASVEKINQSCVRIWQLLLIWAQRARGETTSAAHPCSTQSPLWVNLHQALDFASQSLDSGHAWTGHHNLVDEWYHRLVKHDPLWSANVERSRTLAQDTQLITELVRKVIFTSSPIERFFEEEDTYWVTHKHIIEQLVLQGIAHCTQEISVPIRRLVLPLIQHYDVALDFYVVLVNTTLKYESRLEAVITKHARNWDYARLPVLDQTLLKLALSELFYFSEIPFKVSINEYVTLAKRYSTPQSAPFINGVLDAVATANANT